VVEGDPRNLKVTRPADLAVLRAALGGEGGGG
jgi:2-C-methyl-D-erythritol 4-phosphate cytidylyltransferase